MDLLIKNGTIASSSGIYNADILVKKGKIALISSEGINPAKDVYVIDASNRFVMPGGIDVHTHLDMPFMGTKSVDDFNTGTLAAAYGGNTSIIDYVIPKSGQKLSDALLTWHKKAENKSYIDYGFHMAVVPPVKEVIPELKQLKKLGITSIKCFFAYKNSLMIDESSFLELVREAKKLDILTCVHAEEGEKIDKLTKELLTEAKAGPIYHAISRPPELEGESAEKILELAKQADCSVYFVHLSSRQALERIIEAQKAGLKVFTETCPQYLFLDIEKYNEEGFNGAKYVMSPPLREFDHCNYLISGIFKDNIDVIATDHCSFNYYKEKQLGSSDFTKIPNGIPGLETRLPVLFSELVVKKNLPLTKFIKLVSTNPARIFNLKGKGDIQQGYDADIIIWNPAYEWVIKANNLHHNVDYTPFEGFKAMGKAQTVILRGNILIENFCLKANKPEGKYLNRNSFA